MKHVWENLPRDQVPLKIRDKYVRRCRHCWNMKYSVRDHPKAHFRNYYVYYWGWMFRYKNIPACSNPKEPLIGA